MTTKNGGGVENGAINEIILRYNVYTLSNFLYLCRVNK